MALDGLCILLRLPAVEGRDSTVFTSDTLTGGFALGAGRAYFPRTSRSISAESSRLCEEGVYIDRLNFLGIGGCGVGCGVTIALYLSIGS